MSTTEDKAKALQKARAKEFAAACPSRVIEIALEDLEVVEKNPAYRVDMDVWHYAKEGRCSVCFAGAVMANRLGVPSTRSRVCQDFTDATSDRLLALDSFRRGQIEGGLRTIDGSYRRHHFQHAFVTAYDRDDPTQFKADMRKIVETLRQAGL